MSGTQSESMRRSPGDKSKRATILNKDSYRVVNKIIVHEINKRVSTRTVIKMRAELKM